MNMRKFFNINKKHIILAGGLLITDLKNKKLFLFFNKKRNVYEDFGGKIENKDKNINETINREVSEESNSLITKINKSKGFYSYIPDSKYLLHVVDKSEVNIDKKIKVGKWISIKDIYREKVQINRRLGIYLECNTIDYNPKHIIKIENK